MKKTVIKILLALFFLPILSFGQYTPWYYWTLLPKAQMDEIIGEASGETVWNTIMETAGYTRDRRAEQYRTMFHESAYFMKELQHYGIPGTKLTRIKTDDTWDGIKGELWEVSPNRHKLVSYLDNAFQLASGSQNANVKAELVWVGSGSEKEVSAVDVKGKIAVGEGSVGTIHNNAVRAGAVGVVAISTSRPLFDPLQLPSGSIRGSANIQAKFGFQMNAREGQFLKARLMREEKITAHAQVESKMEPNEIQNIEFMIPGKDPNATAVIMSGHLFEGLTKQGANDNVSGCAALLEVARVLNTLINEGRLPKPKRSIRFIIGPEFSGTGPWVQENFDKIKNAFCNINMDMVGEWLVKNKAHFSLMRTTFGNPHYINDVMENYYRFVGEGNRERIQNRSTVYKVPNRIVAPYGADEPFHYSIETHYGASDHEVFNDFGVKIPGIMMIAWPDQWYHTSGDLVDKSDPTQLKRVVVIGAAGAYNIANADDDMTVKIASEITSNAASRLGHQLVIAMEKINNSIDAKTLENNYKSAVSLIEAHVVNEIATVESVFELTSSKEKISAHIKELIETISAYGTAHLKAVKSNMKMKAAGLKVAEAKIALADAEKKADKIIPALTPKGTKFGYGKSRTLLADVPKETLDKFPIKGRIDQMEVGRLVNGKNSVLMIKKMLDAQGETVADVENVLNYLEQLKAAGVVKF